MKADMVIGADGVLSSVARLAGAATQREGRHATAVVFGYFSDIELADFHWWYRPGIGAGVIPTNVAGTASLLRCRRSDCAGRLAHASDGGVPRDPA